MSQRSFGVQRDEHRTICSQKSTAGGIHNTGLRAQRLPHPLPPLISSPVTPSTQFEHKMQRANKGSGECFREQLLVQMIRWINSMRACHSQPPNHATSYTDTKSVCCMDKTSLDVQPLADRYLARKVSSLILMHLQYCCCSNFSCDWLTKIESSGILFWLTRRPLYNP
jgi:hypothetical protein